MVLFEVKHSKEDRHILTASVLAIFPLGYLPSIAYVRSGPKQKYSDGGPLPQMGPLPMQASQLAIPKQKQQRNGFVWTFGMIR